MPLLEHLKEGERFTIKPAFADDVMLAGTANGNAKVMCYLEDKGPLYGFYIEVEK